MAKVLIQVWSADRTKKKAFMSLPTITDVIAKAHMYGLTGNSLILESDGCEICENEVLEIYAQERKAFLLVSNCEDTPSGYETLANASDNFSSSDFKLVTVPVAEPDTFSSSEFKLVSVPVDEPAPSVVSEECISELKLLTSSPSIDLSPVTSPRMSRADKMSAASESKTRQQLENCKIPWHKMPNDVLHLLESNTYLGSRMKVFCQVLVDDLREVTSHIPVKIFRNLALKAARLYPDSFLEKDRDGNFICNRPDVLISKMVNRNNTLNRPNKRNLSPETSTPPKQRRIDRTLQSTCTNWRATTSKATLNNLATKQQDLKKLFLSGAATQREKTTVVNLMKECFPLQREFLNNSKNVPSVRAIKENWPFLFTKEVLYDHFQLLMATDPRSFRQNFESDRKRFQFFFTSSRSKIFHAASYENDLDIINGLSTYFLENSNFIFKQFKSGTSLEEIQKEIPTYSPWLAVVGSESESEECQCSIFIEELLVFGPEKFNKLDAITMLICFYYTFNMMFPLDCSQTLEFMVRYFLKYYAATVRSSKRTINNISKMNNLINKICKLQ